MERPPGSDLFSHTVASAVSSALKRFTSVFGMGTGGSTSLVPPEGRTMYEYNVCSAIRQPFQNLPLF